MNRIIMTITSSNFKFIEDQLPELALLADFAEKYVYSDSVSSLIKLRTFVEQTVKIIYNEFGISFPGATTLFDLLENDTFKQSVPQELLNKLHSIRISGNKAAHNNFASDKDAKWLLQEAYDIARWIHLTLYNSDITEIPKFSVPAYSNETKKLERSAQTEVKIQGLLKELQKQRDELYSTKKEKNHYQQLLTRAKRVANTLKFNEEQTRFNIIDNMLNSAGWDVKPDKGDSTTVKQELLVKHQPTPSGDGYIDYVLWDDETDKPLAVIEAKKTSVSPRLGQTQAKLYADGLEKDYGCRPVIFFTNGYELFIWDDARNYPERRIYGYYSIESLRYLIKKRQANNFQKIETNINITNRGYQLEGIQRLKEEFDRKKRRCLLVQATGTGKTRVAISFSEVLLKAEQGKRILFLCDRRELRKQAYNAFKEFLQDYPRVTVSSKTAHEKDKRIYFSTYPAMIKVYENFDVGFFDLIIADESHRSIYNRYRYLIEYFDALVVGLTATPKKSILHNTFQLFHCEKENPTHLYTYQEAIEHEPPYLSRFFVQEHRTEFHRRGIKYSEMSNEQQEQLESQEEYPELVEHEPAEVDRKIYNKDTARVVIRNIMEHGQRDKNGSQIGKTIVFARNHKHAVVLHDIFNELYPQFGGKFCQIIDNYDPRAEQLIDDFKGLGSNDNLTIAISVDMLDTGIDVPEIVNLVFAKPVYSYVKFWQMIGRGTRLCDKINKEYFMIYDHWGNFEWFEEEFEEKESKQPKSPKERALLKRIEVAQKTIEKTDTDAFKIIVGLIHQDIKSLPDKSIPVMERWKQVNYLSSIGNLNRFSDDVVQLLFDNAHLMQWVKDDDDDATRFDVLIAELQLHWLRESSQFAPLKKHLLGIIQKLSALSHLKDIAVKMDILNNVNQESYWTGISIKELEDIRLSLREIVHYAKDVILKAPAKVIDVKEDESKIKTSYPDVVYSTADMMAYRQRVESVINQIFDTTPVLQKIKAGVSLTEQDLDALKAAILSQDPNIDFDQLINLYPDSAGHLDHVIRKIIGLDPQKVSEHFDMFTQQHPELDSTQRRFLSMLENHIVKFGSIQEKQLYDAPFTLLDSNGVDGIFHDDENLINAIFQLLKNYQPTR
jgi:type I restriction enzyme, R subunit